MKTSIRIGIFALALLTLSVACTRNPIHMGPPSGGASGLGGQGSGGVANTGGTTNTGPLPGSGGSGSGGTTPPLTGRGGATGGTGLGGSQTGGMPGTGGSTPPGTGGSTLVNTGGVKTGGTTGTVGGSTGAGGAAGIDGAAGGAGGAVGIDGGTGTGVTVKLDQTKQTMEGFGITDTWAPALTDADADALFDPSKGIGLTILRFGMGADGNPMSSNIYSDITKAKARGVATFVATALSAPSNCQQGGHLLASCYDSWAATMAAFPGKVKSNASVDLYAMSAQNEPDYASSDTMLYTAEEMVAFIKVLGPKLKASSPAVKVIAPEATEWGHLWTNQSAPGAADPLGGKYDYGHALAKDLEAWAQVDIVGAQMYDTPVATLWPSDVLDRKPVWMTEVCGVTGWPEAGPSSDISNGVAVAGWIHDAVTNGDASAWIWFWLKALYSDDNEGLLLKDGTDTKRHYTLGNYSKFIRPGYTRVNITGSIPAGVPLSAYKGADGTVVVVAINQGSVTANVPIAISGGTAPASLVPWVTSASENLAQKTALSVSGGAFTAALAGMTVTTFVGK